ELHAGVELTVRLLRLVFQIDFGELQRDVLRRGCAIAGAAGRNGRDDDVVHLDDQVFLLALTGLAHRERRFLDVLTRGAGLEQDRRRFVDAVGGVVVVGMRLAFTPSTSVGQAAALSHAPGPRQHIDFALVFVVEGFAFDVPDLRENVYSHNDTLLR